jgi:cytochrome P450
VPAGRQVLIHNLFNHRNRERIAFADRFAPEEWVSGTGAEDWSFNFFSHGPQGCPGAGLSIFLGQAFLGRLLTAAEPTITAGTRLDPSRPLPHALDLRPLQVALAPR